LEIIIRKKREKTLTGMESPCRVITKSVLSSGSLATSNEHLGLAIRSCRKQQFFKHTMTPGPPKEPQIG